LIPHLSHPSPPPSRKVSAPVHAGCHHPGLPPDGGPNAPIPMTLWQFGQATRITRKPPRRQRRHFCRLNLLDGSFAVRAARSLWHAASVGERQSLLARRRLPAAFRLRLQRSDRRSVRWRPRLHTPAPVAATAAGCSRALAANGRGIPHAPCSEPPSDRPMHRAT
jgi:hypothetical protein